MPGLFDSLLSLTQIPGETAGRVPAPRGAMGEGRRHDDPPTFRWMVLGGYDIPVRFLQLHSERLSLRRAVTR